MYVPEPVTVAVAPPFAPPLQLTLGAADATTVKLGATGELTINDMQFDLFGREFVVDQFVESYINASKADFVPVDPLVAQSK